MVVEERPGRERVAPRPHGRPQPRATTTSPLAAFACAGSDGSCSVHGKSNVGDESNDDRPRHAKSEQVQGCQQPGSPDGAFCDPRGNSNSTNKRDETMKTEFKTVVASCLRKALASGRACFEERRKMNLRLLAAFVALSFLAPFLIGEAEAACPPSKRLKHSDSSCIHAWWDNSPSSSCWGTKGGAQSFCSEYGKVEVNVDIKNDADFFMTFRSSSKARYHDCTNDTRQISCCKDTSDLCKKSEVENTGGWIQVYDPSNNSYKSMNVGKHKYRYNYCKDNRKSIYCKNDPKGDAFTKPLLCDGSLCRVRDCRSGWNQSNAAISGECEFQSISLDDSNLFDPRCTVAVACPDPETTGNEIVVTTWPVEMSSMIYLQYCDDGSLKVYC